MDEDGDPDLFAQEFADADEVYKQAASSTATHGRTLWSDDDDDGGNICEDDAATDVEMFLYDVQQDSTSKGGVILFGKVWCTKRRCYQSAAIYIKDIPYTLYAKVRQGSTMKEAVRNIKSMLQTKCIRPESVHIRKCTRSFWFDHQGRDLSTGGISLIETGSEMPFVKISYSSNYALLDRMPDIACSSAVEAIIGTTYSAVERFVLPNKIRGSCWIRVKQATPVQVNAFYNGKKTHCVYEWHVDNGDNFEKIAAPSSSSSFNEVPPLKICCMRICTVLRHTTTGDGVEELAAIHLESRMMTGDGEIYDDEDDDGDDDDIMSPVYHDSRDGFSATSSTTVFLSRNLPGVTYRRAGDLDGEVNLLRELSDAIRTMDPDIIVGHKLMHDLRFLLGRYRLRKMRKEPSWQYFGRVRYKDTMDPPLMHMFAGRFYCDLWEFFQGPNINTSGRESYLTYDLAEMERRRLETTLLQSGSGLQSEDLRNTVHTNARYFMMQCRFEQLKRTLRTTSRVCFKLVRNTNAIQLALDQASISGCPLSVAFSTSRYKANEWLLMHAMYASHWVIADVHQEKRGKRTRNEMEDDGTSTGAATTTSYEGGKVLVPCYGVHTKETVLIDFQSMYPYIVEKYLLCFSSNDDDKLLPTIMRDLMDARIRIRKAVVRAGDKNDIYQIALKGSANRMYGCLGFALSRFFKLSLAEEVTRIGRMVLDKASGIAEECGYKVVYGDTDSIAIQHGDDGDMVPLKDLIQRVFRETKIRIKVDGTFERVLFHKKKTFSFLPVEAVGRDADGKRVVLDMSKRVDKGLATINRSVPPVAKFHAHALLKAIMTASAELLGDTRAIALFVKNLIEKEEKDVITQRPLEDFVMYRQLNMHLYRYERMSQQQHVRVAHWLKNNGHSTPQAHEAIAFVMCEGGVPCHPHQLKEYPCKYSIDYRYYKQAVIRTLFSLCEAVDKNLPSMITSYLSEQQ